MVPAEKNIFLNSFLGFVLRGLPKSLWRCVESAESAVSQH